MSTIDNTSPTNPAEPPYVSPQRVPRVTVFIHSVPDQQTTPAVRLLKPVPEAPSEPIEVPPAKRTGGKHRMADPTWLGLLERVLCSWPITFRVAFLLAIVLTGTAAVAAVLGIGGQLILAALSLHGRRIRRLSPQE